MNTRTKFIIILILCLIVVAGVGTYFVLKYKKAHDGIALQCGAIDLTVSRAFMNLSKPSTLTSLDANGCYIDTNGCACAKLDPKTNNGMIMGITSANNPGIQIPQADADQKTFFSNLAELMKSNISTTTSITAEVSTFKNHPSLSVTTLATTPQGSGKGQDIFFINNGKLYDATFQTNASSFDTYWPEINASFQTVSFVK
jgi:hypothetical protein